MDIIDFAANMSTLAVFFKDLNLRLPVSTVRNAISFQKEIENILPEIFLKKQVMWESPQFEDVNWCINSLKDLRDKCDQLSEHFLKISNATNDEYHLFALILKSLGTYCDEAWKEITKMGLKNVSLGKVLKSFRKNSYPFVLVFIYSLPATSIIQQQCEAKFQKGLKNSNLTLESIKPNWMIGI